MKKRVKLLTTIASLCLAVALMAFGVYAASSAKFGVTGTVTFTASKDVYLNYTSIAYAQSSTLNETDASKITDETALTATVSDDSKWTTIDGNGAPKQEVTAGSATGLAYAFKTAAQNNGTAIYAYKVVLTFKTTHAMNGFSVTLADTYGAEQEAQANINYVKTITVDGAEYTAPVDVDANKDVVITIVVSVKDAAVEVQETAYTTTITFAVAE